MLAVKSYQATPKIGVVPGSTHKAPTPYLFTKTPLSGMPWKQNIKLFTVYLSEELATALMQYATPSNRFSVCSALSVISKHEGIEQ